MVWEIAAAALTRVGARGGAGEAAANDDAIGVNGWAMRGLGPSVWESRHALGGAEAFAVADGIQRGYGGLAAALLARELSTAERLGDQGKVAESIGRLHAELLDGGYFASHWDVAPERLRLPGATVAGCRVAPGSAEELLFFNVGDAGAFVVVNGQLARQSIEDRADSGMLTACVGGGPPGEPRPHFAALALGRVNRVLLCSDGLTDAVPPATLDQIVCGSPTPSATVRRLISAATAAAAQDDVTALAADIRWL